MTDRLNSDLDALLGESQPDGDPAIERRRAELAGALAEALDPDTESAPMAPDAAMLAAHIDGQLEGEERAVLLRKMTASPAVAADVESAAALVEMVDSAPQRAPKSALLSAKNQLARRRPAPAVAPRWQWLNWLTLPQTQLGFGVAAAAALVAILGPLKTEISATHKLAPDTSGTATAGASAWAAIAASPSTHVTGTASAATRAEASDAALAACAKSGASDCAVLFSDRGQCAAVLAQPDGTLRVLIDQNPQAIVPTPQNCESDQGGGCRVLDSICGH